MNSLVQKHAVSKRIRCSVVVRRKPLLGSGNIDANHRHPVIFNGDKCGLQSMSMRNNH